MSDAKKFLSLLENLADICDNIVKRNGLNGSKKLNSFSIKQKLFSKTDYHNDNYTAVCKIGITTKVNESYIMIFLEKLLDKDTDTNSNSKRLFMNPFELFYEKDIAKNIKLNDMHSLYTSIKGIYNEEKIYLWFKFEEKLKCTYGFPESFNPDESHIDSQIKQNDLFDYYIDAFGYYLILLITSVGFSNNIFKLDKSFSIPSFDKFVKELESKRKILFKGDFRAGKTTFLKQFLNQNNKNIYYLDSNRNDITNKDIALAFCPYAKCWIENEKIKEFLVEHKNFISPLPDETQDISVICQNLSSEDVLIIDHISENAIHIIEDLNKLKCKIVFVPDNGVDASEYNIETYYYDNSNALISIIKKTTHDKKIISEDDLQKLKKQLGSDVLVYKMVGLAYNAHYKKYNNFDLIEKLLVVENFDNFDEIFEDIERVSFSYDHSEETVGNSRRYLENHIEIIYSRYFGNVDLTTNSSKDRVNPIHHHLLRLLCRLKKRNVSYSEVKEILNFKVSGKDEENIYHIIEKLEWVKDDRICVPDFIAYSFNRKGKFNEEQYQEALGIRHALNSFVTKNNVWLPMKSELYTALSLCFLEDICYLEKRAKKIDEQNDKKIDKVIKKNEKIYNGKAEGEFETIESDATLTKFLLLEFLLKTFSFSLKYNKPNLWKKSKVVLEENEPGTLILELVNKFDNKLHPKNGNWVIYDLEHYRHDGSALIFLMEMYIHFLNEEVLRLIKTKDSTGNFKIAWESLYRLKIFIYLSQFKMVLEFYDKQCCQNNNQDNKYKSFKNILIFYTAIYKVYKTVFDGACVNESIDFLKNIESHNSEGNSIKISENFVILICNAIMQFSNLKDFDDAQKNIIKYLVKELKKYKKDSGDLPKNIAEIFEITKKFLCDNDFGD